MTEKKRAYLLINTGSPAAPTPEAVRSYLIEFLTDPEIMGMPKFFRELLVRRIIAPTRAPKSAERYQQVWLPEGAPLVIYTEGLARELARLSGTPVYVGMRYEPGSVERALRRAAEEGVTELLSQPLFPQYATSSFRTAAEHVRTIYNRMKPPFRLVERGFFFDNPHYVRAMAEQVEMANLAPGTHLITSYHGLPLSQAKPYYGDPARDYPAQCRRTTALLMAEPEVRRVASSCEVTYQSRFGFCWLTPELKTRLRALPHEGVKRVAVICPTFVADCLETIEEVGIQGRKLFMEAGGEQFTLISSPNASPTLAAAFLAE